MKKLLFILTNDGSDIRTTKEITSLSSEFDVIFLGMGCNKQSVPLSELCYKYILVDGKRNSWWNLLKFVYEFIKILLTQKISTIHVVNENVVVYFYPFLFFKHVVLDLYDSFFLRYNISKDSMYLLKYIIYAPVNRIIVTDENRLDLTHDKLKHKCVVIPNVPSVKLNYSDFVKVTQNDIISIAFVGALGKSRGAEILETLCKQFPNKVKVVMAGWLHDDISKRLSFYDNVEYIGIVEQYEINKIISSRCDYILSLYEPSNQNNINASPNKIYDSIHTRTPIILNAEIKASSYVKEKNIGYIMESFYNVNYYNLFKDLMNSRDLYSFPEKLISENSWENYEGILLSLHQVK